MKESYSALLYYRPKYGLIFAQPVITKLTCKHGKLIMFGVGKECKLLINNNKSKQMKPLDISKFRTNITKSINGISVGFNDPQTWVHTGNYALNYLISSDFFKGIPLGKSTILGGESGSGKSFIASGNIVREAQKQGIFVVLIDTENALDEAWLKALDVDTSPEKILRISASMIDDVAKIISDFMKEYKANYAGEKPEDRPKVMFVIDSLGMLMTPTDVAQFEAGEMKGDMGRKPKALKALVTNVTNMFGEYDIGLVATNHTYASQDMFDPDPKMSGGAGIVYAASIVVGMGKRKLKEDEDGNKTSEVNGIRSAIKVMKSRYAKPFETMEIKIPYESGMDPFSGLIELFEAKGVLQKEGNKLKYIDLKGTEHKYFRKQISDELLMQIMKEWKLKHESDEDGVITAQEYVGAEIDQRMAEEGEEAA